jgi:hypothetical protein
MAVKNSEIYPIWCFKSLKYIHLFQLACAYTTRKIIIECAISETVLLVCIRHKKTRTTD